jgi:hypothetical protein
MPKYQLNFDGDIVVLRHARTLEEARRQVFKEDWGAIEEIAVESESDASLPAHAPSTE